MLHYVESDRPLHSTNVLCLKPYQLGIFADNIRFPNSLTLDKYVISLTSMKYLNHTA